MNQQRGLSTGHVALITNSIIQKQQVYYLVTEESLKAIKEKSIVADILFLITSLLFGAFFSVLITLNATVYLPEGMIGTLSIYQWLFFGFGCIFLIMTVVTWISGNRLIAQVTKSDTAITTSGKMF